MLAKRLSAFAVTCLLLSIAGRGFADPVGDAIRVQYAVLLDGRDPVSGTALCTVGTPCALLSEAQPRFEVDLRIGRDENSLISEMEVRCEVDCAFSNGQAQIRFREASEFEIFEGRFGVRIPLVLKPRTRIGQVLLAYQ